MFGTEPRRRAEVREARPAEALAARAAQREARDARHRAVAVAAGVELGEFRGGGLALFVEQRGDARVADRDGRACAVDVLYEHRADGRAVY